MTRAIAALALFFFLVPVTYIHGPEPERDKSQYINLIPIKFHTEDPTRTKIGRLDFLAGWKMTSTNHGFGGISSMLAQPKNRFFLLSDLGTLIGFTLDEGNSRAVRPFIAPLPDGPAKENEFAKQNWDAEAIAHNPKTGQFWVGYEHHQSIWRYGPSFARREQSRRPPKMRKWPRNGGVEAMLRLPDGKFLVFSESAPFKAGGYEALLFQGDPVLSDNKPAIFGYQPPKGYHITDAALLPDGRVLLLHRRVAPLTGWSAILSIGDLSEIAAGKVWTSKKMATLKPPHRVDNMEALAVTEEKGDTIVWIASDNNFVAIQESLLLKFRLLKGKEKPTKGRASETEKAGNDPGFSALQN